MGLGISTSSTAISSSRQKRKRDEGLVNGSGEMKRSKSGDSRTDVEIATDAEKVELDATGLHSI